MTPVDGATSDERYLLDPTEVTLRHIKMGDGSQFGSVKVLDFNFYPDPVGLNGALGFQNGSYDRKVSEEGTFTVTFANGAGQDGVLHRDRFALLDEEQYRPGDEWIEVWRGQTCEFVGTPTSYDLSLTTLTITGYSAFWLLKKSREKAAGYWATAPRDVLEYYLSVWQGVLSQSFEGWNEIATETTPLTSADGVWQYAYTKNGRNGPIIYSPTGKSSGSALLNVTAFSIPTGATVTHHGWRAEARVVMLNEFGDTGGWYFQVGDFTTLEANSRCWINIEVSGITIYNGAAHEKHSYKLAAGEHTVCIERRDRWDYFYVDGKLIGYLAAPKTAPKVLRVNLGTGATLPSVAIEIEVKEVHVQRNRPFLYDSAHPGPYDLPGAPPVGGLEGHYHRDEDTWRTAWATASKIGKLLHPSRESDPSAQSSGGLYQNRIDKTLNFPSSTTWMPPGPREGEYFSSRWVGSVYLDFDNFDFVFRVESDDRIRVWIGKTQWNEEYINDWNEAGHGMTLVAGAWLKAGSAAGVAPTGSSGILSGMSSGWYPIIIEYSNGAGPSGVKVEYSRSDSYTLWSVLGLPAAPGEGGTHGEPAASIVRCSPIGVYQATVQFDSHYDAFQNVVAMFGYQWIETPQSLESGKFPGYVEFSDRIGSDTDYVLEREESTEIAAKGSADDLADAIVAEAAGLGDPSQSAQITAEIFNYPYEDRLFIQQEQESLSDINIEALALQRGRSLLALRNDVWEEIGAKPSGHRRLVDQFPLTGVLREFKWAPGDGLRLHFPEVKIEDATPRQIMSLSQPFVPDGFGVPSATFRQRPRSLVRTLREMIRQTTTARRNYQGQLVAVQGSVGGNSGGQSADANSRVVIPSNMTSIAAATISVIHKSDTSEVELTVGGVATGIKVVRPGRYDVTPWIYTTSTMTVNRMLASFTGGTGTIELVLELLVRV